MAAAEAGKYDAGSLYFSVGRKVPDVACLPSYAVSGGGRGRAEEETGRAQGGPGAVRVLLRVRRVRIVLATGMMGYPLIFCGLFLV